jgi:hypothetical protein
LPLKARLLLVAVIAAFLTVPPAAGAAPGRDILITVVLTDSGTRLGLYVNTTVGNLSQQAPLLGPLSKLDDVHFAIYNTGKKTHGFTVFGTTTTVKPGHNATFVRQPPGGGKFAYSSPTDKGKAFRGILTVSSKPPPKPDPNTNAIGQNA